MVVISNLRDEEGSEIASSLRLLARRHLVLLASLREGVLDDALERPIRGLDDALRAGAIHHYLAARGRAHDALKGLGILWCDITPARLPITIVNRYLDIKRSGAL